MSPLSLPVRPSALALAAALVTTALPAQWSEDPYENQAVVTRPGDQAIPKAAATPDGGSWVAWFDNASGNYDVYLQRYDSKGHAVFPVGGMLVSGHAQSSSLVNWDLIADAAGAAVLAFTDTRAGGDLDVYLYKIGADGSFLWGANGVAASANADFEADPRLALASDGDVVVVWSFLGSPAAVRMQRYDAAGTALLAAGGLTVASEAGRSPGFAEIAPSASGDVIVSWVRDINFFTSVKHLRAQRFDAAGAPQWPAPVEVFDAHNLPIAYAPQLLADGAGGAVLCWHASNPATNLFDGYVQRLSSAGAELYGHNGVPISSTGGRNHLSPTAAYVAATGDTVVYWNEKDSSQNLSGLYAQKIDAAGVRQWGSGGIELMSVSTSPVYPPSAVPVGDGAMAFVTWAPTSTWGQDQLLAFRLDASGASPWGGARDLCTRQSNKSVRHAVAQNASGEAVVYWEDERNGSDDVYGQNITADGERGVRYLEVDVASISLAAGGSAQLQMDAGAAHAGMSYAMLGSHTGTSPGQNGYGIHLPLNDGQYFQLTFTNPGFGIFSGFRGALDGAGQATAAVTLPAGTNPALAGLTIHHAFVVLDGPGSIVLVSEPRPFLLQP